MDQRNIHRAHQQCGDWVCVLGYIVMLVMVTCTMYAAKKEVACGAEAEC
jgi:hypothetical protein